MKWLLKLKKLNSQKVLLKLLVAFLEPSQTSKMELFVKKVIIILQFLSRGEIQKCLI